MTKYLLLTAGVALVVVLGFILDAQSRTPVVRQDNLPPESRIFALGRIEADTPEIELRSRLSGRIAEILVEEGQTVRKGDVLLRIDREQHKVEVDLAAAELELADAQLERLVNGAHPQERSEAAALHRAKQAELERAQLSWKRIAELAAAKAISQQDADDQRTLVDALLAEVEAAKARLERLEAPARVDEVRIDQARVQSAQAKRDLAKVYLQWTEVSAPCDGQILKLDVEVGELIGPESKEPTVVMADTSRFHVRAFVEEVDAPRVRVGMSAKVVAAGLPDREFSGQVVRLSPRMSRKELWSDQPSERYDTKTREVWVDLSGNDPWVVGLRVDLIIDPTASETPPSASSASMIGHGGDEESRTKPRQTELPQALSSTPRSG